MKLWIARRFGVGRLPFAPRASGPIVGLVVLAALALR